MMRETKNAQIESTMLGQEDHGIFTCFLTLNYGGSGQGFGGYALDNWNEDERRRHGTAYGAEFIMQVLRVVGVEKWEDLPGRYVRADADHGKVYRIGHITRDVWFDPKELAEQMRPAGGGAQAARPS